MVAGAFVLLVILVFLTQQKKPINWIEDYQTGVNLAKTSGKPLLLAFYKKDTRFSTEIWNNTYNNGKVKKYVEANFIPVLIDADKQPAIAELYKINYYPTHHIKRMDNNEIVGTMRGYNPPGAFIKGLEEIRTRVKPSPK